MKMEELKQKSTEELVDMLGRLRETLRDYRFKVAANQLSDLHRIPEIKKTIARILTLLNNSDAK